MLWSIISGRCDSFKGSHTHPKSVDFVLQYIFAFYIPFLKMFITNLNLKQMRFVFVMECAFNRWCEHSLHKKTAYFKPRPDMIFPFWNTPLVSYLLVLPLRFFCLWHPVIPGFHIKMWPFCSARCAPRPTRWSASRGDCVAAPGAPSSLGASSCLHSAGWREFFTRNIC